MALIASKIDGSISPNDGMAYLEWTFEVKNDSRRAREARLQLALPPNSVVSRASLWINGEPKEAAFAGRAQVRKAYESIVRRQQDPLLVTSNGADRVLPRIIERNFEINTEHTLWLESKKALSIGAVQITAQQVNHSLYRLTGSLDDHQLSGPGNQITAQRDSSVTQLMAKYADTTIHQQVVAVQRPKKDALMIVVDGSGGVESSINQVIGALKHIPLGQKVGLLIAADGIQSVAIAPWSVEQQQRIARLLDVADFVGGQNNVPALRVALMQLEAYQNAELLWVHAPQPVIFGDSADSLTQAIERLTLLPSIALYALTPGANKH